MWLISTSVSPNSSAIVLGFEGLLTYVGLFRSVQIYFQILLPLLHHLSSDITQIPFLTPCLSPKQFQSPYLHLQRNVEFHVSFTREAYGCSSWRRGKVSVCLDTDRSLGAIITAWRQVKWVNALPCPSPRRQLAVKAHLEGSEGRMHPWLRTWASLIVLTASPLWKAVHHSVSAQLKYYNFLEEKSLS